VIVKAALGQRLQVLSGSKEAHTLAEFTIDNSLQVVPLLAQCQLTTAYIAGVNRKGLQYFINTLDFGSACTSRRMTAQEPMLVQPVIASSLCPGTSYGTQSRTDKCAVNQMADQDEHTHFLKMLHVDMFTASAMSLILDNPVIFVRFKKVSPRGLQEEAARVCSMVINDFLGCMVAESAQLSAFVLWARSRLWCLAECKSGCRLQILSFAAATTKFKDSENLNVESMAENALRLFAHTKVRKAASCSTMHKTPAVGRPVCVQHVVPPPTKVPREDSTSCSEQGHSPSSNGKLTPPVEVGAKVLPHSNNVPSKDETVPSEESIRISLRAANLGKLPSSYDANLFVKNTFIDQNFDDADDDQPMVTRSKSAPWAFGNQQFGSADEDPACAPHPSSNEATACDPPRSISNPVESASASEDQEDQATQAQQQSHVMHTGAKLDQLSSYDDSKLRKPPVFQYPKLRIKNTFWDYDGDDSDDEQPVIARARSDPMESSLSRVSA
jgi:hypothetical protein